MHNSRETIVVRVDIEQPLVPGAGDEEKEKGRRAKMQTKRQGKSWRIKKRKDKTKYESKEEDYGARETKLYHNH